ncbi:MAG: ATP-dependent protease subunit HslV [Candidatus Bipolaricaulota bacterium]
MERVRNTTILALHSPEERRAVLASDGQATFETTIIKQNTRKVYRLHDDRVIVGFAGATADCLALLDKFEGKLKKYDGKLRRSAVELTKEWRTDRILRHLEAVMLTVSEEGLLMISGVGDVLEPDGGVMGIGSGGPYALAAATAFLSTRSMPMDEIARRSLEIAAQIDIYTNDRIVVETLSW